MYNLLKLYAKPIRGEEAVICIDEKSLQLIARSREPLPVAPDVPAKLDTNTCCPLRRRGCFHHTRKHADWLNMAEIEIGILTHQCLDRSLPSQQLLRRQVDAGKQIEMHCVKPSSGRSLDKTQIKSSGVTTFQNSRVDVLGRQTSPPPLSVRTGDGGRIRVDGALEHEVGTPLHQRLGKVIVIEQLGFRGRCLRFPRVGRWRRFAPNRRWGVRARLACGRQHSTMQTSRRGRNSSRHNPDANRLGWPWRTQPSFCVVRYLAAHRLADLARIVLVAGPAEPDDLRPVVYRHSSFLA